ncbi:MAG: GNAT family N-acetyltransferase [Christensenellales bacterium]
MDEFYTRRLFFRRFKISDLMDFYQYAKHPKVGPAAGWAPHKSIEESKRTLLHFCLNKEIWAIVWRDTGKMIGTIGLHRKTDAQGQGFFELGYALAYAYWGKGIMTEAVTKVLEVAFTVMHLKELYVSHFPDNDRSRHIIEKCGFHYVETVSDSCCMYDGSLKDRIVYRMKRESYLQHLE